tara:strand:- start:1268 stop:1663 length:396 start_codon:yes stop_codon:yes gene_type:complete
MGTLKATLILKDSTTLSDELNFSVTDDLTTAAPSRSLSLETVTQTGGNHIIVPSATAVAYLFVRHTGTTDGSTGTSATVDLEISDDNSAFARLNAGEFLFMPFNHAGADVGCQLQSSSGNVLCEYAFFTKG